MPKVLVRLWDHVGTGIIISWPSGIVYTNQAYGKANQEFELEGIFVPVGNDLSLDGKLLSPQVRLAEYFRGPPHFGNVDVNGLLEAEAVLVESALHENLLLRNVTVDRQRLHESFEGWVQVRIASPTPDDRFPLFEGLGPFPLAGVLTWTNVA